MLNIGKDLRISDCALPKGTQDPREKATGPEVCVAEKVAPCAFALLGNKLWVYCRWYLEELDNIEEQVNGCYIILESLYGDPEDFGQHILRE